MKNKRVKQMMEPYIGRSNWVAISRDEFFKSFNVREASLVSSYTDCKNDNAATIFSMDGAQDTHFTRHIYGLKNDPEYLINKNAKNISGVVSLTANQLKGINQ